MIEQDCLLCDNCEQTKGIQLLETETSELWLCEKCLELYDARFNTLSKELTEDDLL